MKNFMKTAAFCCAALISFSCQEIELSVTESPSAEPCTLNASIEDTRTLLNGLKTTWVKDDPVAIIDGTACRKFTVAESGSSTTLKGELTSGCESVGGVFPWTSSSNINTSNNKVISTTAFPAEQTVADGSNLPLYAPWTDVDDVLCFKQLGAVVKFEIGTGNANLFKSVKFEDNSSSLNISGPAFVNLATGNVAKSGAQYDYVIYKPASGTIPAGTYYLPIKVEGAPDSTTGTEPSITFAKGVTFTFETTDGKHYQIGSPQSLTVSRGDMCDFGELDPLGPIEPFTYPEVSGISPIVNMLYGTEFTATTTDMSGTVNFKHITDGIQLTDENGYAVAGARITVPGNTSFQVPCGEGKIHDTYCLVKGFGPNCNNMPVYFSTPVSEKVYGELELSGCVNQAQGYLTSLKLEWSTDNTNWNAFTAVYGKNQQTTDSASGSTLSYSKLKSNDDGWFTGEFEIPEASAAPAGGTLYFRLTPTFSVSMATTRTFRVNQGFIVKSRMENTSFAGNDILASNNFSECVSGVDCVIGKPVRYLSYLGAGTTVSEMDGWIFTYPTGKPFNSMRGCVCTQSCTNSAPAYITSPALSAISGTADVVVTFKVCTYFPATEELGADLISVSATDCGMALPVIKCSEMVPAGAVYTTPALFQWHTYYALVRRATSTTKVSVGVVATSSTAGDARYFIDDIVITKL